jgi:anti-anti-sigma factor
MKLTLIPSDPGVVRIASAEDVTMLDFMDGADPLEALLGQDVYKQIVLLDLAQSNYMDSTGVGWLIQCKSRFERAGGNLVLHSLAPMVVHCLRVLGLQAVLHTAADYNAALVVAGVRPAAVPS